MANNAPAQRALPSRRWTQPRATARPITGVSSELQSRRRNTAPIRSARSERPRQSLNYGTYLRRDDIYESPASSPNRSQRAQIFPRRDVRPRMRTLSPSSATSCSRSRSVSSESEGSRQFLDRSHMVSLGPTSSSTDTSVSRSASETSSVRSLSPPRLGVRPRAFPPTRPASVSGSSVISSSVSASSSSRPSSPFARGLSARPLQRHYTPPPASSRVPDRQLAPTNRASGLQSPGDRSRLNAAQQAQLLYANRYSQTSTDAYSVDVGTPFGHVSINSSGPVLVRPAGGNPSAPADHRQSRQLTGRGQRYITQG